jgi:hypothetical protein
MNQPAPKFPNPDIQYFQEQNQLFTDGLVDIDWSENKELAGITLVHSCPICGHADGINVFLPTNNALWKTRNSASSAEKTASSAEFIECQCTENHTGRPANVTGCGRWGMITPKIKG